MVFYRRIGGVYVYKKTGTARNVRVGGKRLLVHEVKIVYPERVRGNITSLSQYQLNKMDRVERWP